MSRRPSCPIRVLACAVVALGLPNVSRAVEWAAEPRIGIGAEYNDNIFLTTVAHEAVHGFSLTPSLDFSAGQPNWEVRSSTQLTDKRYAGRSDISGDSGTETLTYKFNTERSLLRLKGSYTDEAAWSGSSINPDIGLVQTNIRRYTTMANLTWMWALSETIQLTADYQWSAVRYPKGLRANLLDYQQQIPSLSLTDRISERTKLTAAVAYSEFEVTTPVRDLYFPLNIYTGKSSTNFAQIGIAHDFTDTLKGTLSAGPRNTTQQIVSLPWMVLFVNQASCVYFMTSTGQDPSACDSVQQTSHGHGTVFSGILESTLELTHATLSLSRSVDGSGSGSQVETTNASLRIDRQLTPERLSLSLAADGYLVNALGVTTTATDRHYYSVSPGLHWRWTENLSLDGSYRYTRQRYVGNSDYARSNAVYLSLTYNWPKFSVSR